MQHMQPYQYPQWCSNAGVVPLQKWAEEAKEERSRSSQVARVVRDLAALAGKVRAFDGIAVDAENRGAL